MKILDLYSPNQNLTEAPLPNDWDSSAFNTNYPKSDNDPKVSTFSGRLRYALDRSKKVGVGSSRVVMIIDYEGRPTALKIAKNAKGMAQNAAEVDVLEDGYVQNLDITIPLIDYDKANNSPVWIQTELANKASEKQLCNIMKCPSLYALSICAEYQIGRRKHYFNKNPITVWTSPPYSTNEQDNETFMEYINLVGDLANSANVVLGDLGRVSNWGLYEGRPVVVDLGFTESVRSNHYIK